ncbi:hypothetical protein FKM82_027020, partial [Ascaphus truei]
CGGRDRLIAPLCLSSLNIFPLSQLYQRDFWGLPPLGNGYPPTDLKNPLQQQPPPMQPPPYYPPPGPPGPYPGPHGPPPGGPRMMGPPPPQRDGYWEPPPNDHMRGGHHGDRGGMRGGGEWGPSPPPFHWGRGGRGGEPGYRGRGGRKDRGSPGGGRQGPYGRGHGGEHRGHGGEHRGHGGEHRGQGGEHRGHGGEHSGQGHISDKSDRPICRHFVTKGKCNYENNCAFYHPGANGPPLL